MTEKIRLLGQDGHLCTVNIEDIIAIKPTADGPEFFTKEGTFFYPSTMDELLLMFQDNNFERLDRTNLVNMNHVVAFDPKARKVYFEDPWDKESKFATVSEVNLHKVEHLAKENTAKYKAVPKPSLFWNK